jgi:Rieske Fe-S protein
MAALGMPGGSAEALVIRFGSAIGRAGDEHTYPIPAADGAVIDRDTEVILVRYQGKVFAFALSCPHQNTALKWLADEGRFQCPKHKSRYQPDGTFISGRATRGMDRFALRRDGDKVVVLLDTLFKQDKDPAGWAGADLTV